MRATRQRRARRSVALFSGAAAVACGQMLWASAHAPSSRAFRSLREDAKVRHRSDATDPRRAAPDFSSVTSRLSRHATVESMSERPRMNNGTPSLGIPRKVKVAGSASPPSRPSGGRQMIGHHPGAPEKISLCDIMRRFHANFLPQAVSTFAEYALVSATRAPQPEKSGAHETPPRSGGNRCRSRSTAG